MMKISIAREQAVVEVEGFDKLWALRSHVHIPLAHITSVEANAERLAGRQQSGLQQIASTERGSGSVPRCVSRSD
jgi:hypothetical protein